MGPEQRYCRAPIARMFNSMPGTRWIPNINTTFASTIKGGQYESGRPDGFVFRQGRVACVECKADFGSVFLGDPSKPEKTGGWHFSQRNWCHNVADYTGTPYWIALWAYPEFTPDRVRNSDAFFFLLPPSVWVYAETFGSRLPVTVDVKGARKKEATILDLFAPYSLLRIGGEWHIPASHSFFQPLSLHSRI